MAEITMGNLYDFNKNAMGQLKPLDPIEFNLKAKEVGNDIISANSKYWMLLCHERRDYTVFHITGGIDSFVKEFCPTLLNRGKVVSIDKQEDGNYEIWIRDSLTSENFAYYLFDYSFGIVEVE